jgi:cardiolipin synthase (CMP-forming)
VSVLANMISMTRLPLAIAFPIASDPFSRLTIALAAFVSDIADGMVARRTGRTSRFGAILDPVTDRIFVLAVLGTFAVEGTLGAGQLALLLLRDIFTAVGYLVVRFARLPVPLRARPTGKAVTGLQILIVPVVLFAPGLIPPLVGAVTVASVVAMLDYSRAAWLALQRAR